MWKRQYISKGGRLTLIQNTLSSMPIYFVSILFAKKSEVEIGKDSKGFSVGWGSSRPKATPCHVELDLL